MNHDASHCLNYDKKVCPKSCYRAQLTQELEDRRKDLIGIPMTWSAFRGTEECELTKKEKKDLSKWLDEMETALVRAETSRKDIDLIVTMRAVRALLEKDVKDAQ